MKPTPEGHGTHGAHGHEEEHGHDLEHMDAQELHEHENGEAARKEAHEQMEKGLTGAVERGESSLSSDMKKRLYLDLLTNGTMDYSRINLTEIFTAFNFDVDNTITHWRLAKIMDSIIVCYDELKILKEVLRPADVIKKVIDIVQKGEADIPRIEVEVENPETHQMESAKASLADMAYFADVMKMNRELLRSGFSQKELAWRFFTSQSLNVTLKSVGGEEAKTISLVDQQLNPRDSYSENSIGDTVARYKQIIKSNQGSMQMVGDWRDESAGHRELAGHAFITKMDGELVWTALSGRMAARIGKEDMQKSSADGGKVSLNGQPQEIGEMDEEGTGAVVRFRLVDLAQRKVAGSDVSRLQGSTRRMTKAMVGLTLNEEASADEKPMDDKDAAASKEGKKSSKFKTIWLGGRKPGDLIKSMHTHYDRPLKQWRGKAMTDAEAYDQAFLDVFAPCLINNENDWYVSLASVYNVGGPQGARSLVLRPDKFLDFELNIQCELLDDEGEKKKGEIHWKTFTSMQQLRQYLQRRVQRGDLNQSVNDNFGDPDKIDLNEKFEFEVKEEISDAEGEALGGLLNVLLKDYAGDYIKKYKEGRANKLNSPRPELTTGGYGEWVPYGTVVEDTPTRSFVNIIRHELEQYENKAELYEYFNKLYSVDFERNEEMVTPAIDAIVATLAKLKETERKKIKSVT